MSKFVLTAAFLMAFHYTSAQRVYYVSSSTGNDSNTGLSISSPWKTLEKAAAKIADKTLLPGDTLLLKKGDIWRASSASQLAVFDFPGNTQGAVGKYYTIKSYGTGNKPLITNSVNSTEKGFFTIRTNGIKYLVIDGLAFEGPFNFRATDPGGNVVGVTNIKILNCEFTNSSHTFYNPYHPSKAPYPNEGFPINNIEYGYNIFKGSYGGDILNMGAVDHSIWIHHNSFYDSGEEAVDIGGGYNIKVEYNFVSGSKVQGMKLHSQFKPMTELLLRGNVITGCGGYGLALENISNALVHNNTIIGNPTALFLGWLHANGPLLSDFSNNTFSNNIISGVLIGGIPDGVTYTYADGSKGTIKANEIWADNYFNNNVFCLSPNFKDLTTLVRIIKWKGTINYDPTKDNNRGAYVTGSDYVQSDIKITTSGFKDQWATLTNINNDVFADPQMENLSYTSAYVYGNYRLKASSPFTEFGIQINNYLKDIDGKSVPVGSNPSCGAYQYSSGNQASFYIESIIPLDNTTILVNFNNEVNQTDAQNSSLYKITPEMTIKSAKLAGTNQIKLTTSYAYGFQNYYLTVSSIKDISGNEILPSTVTFTIPFNKISVKDVTASETSDLNTDPLYTVDGLGYYDGDPYSRWAAKPMPQELVFDLGSVKEIRKSKFSFYNWENGRRYNYSLQASKDRVNWVILADSLISEKEEWSFAEFNPESCRYVKLICNKAYDDDPTFPNWANVWEAEIFGIDETTDTSSQKELSDFTLEQNYPNPFNPETYITFNLPKSTHVKLDIYGITGQLIQTIADSPFPAGKTSIKFNASNLAAGIYFYKLNTENFNSVKKMTLLK